jgi:hypothetical protein
MAKRRRLCYPTVKNYELITFSRCRIPFWPSIKVCKLANPANRFNSAWTNLFHLKSKISTRSSNSSAAGIRSRPAFWQFACRPSSVQKHLPGHFGREFAQQLFLMDKKRKNWKKNLPMRNIINCGQK